MKKSQIISLVCGFVVVIGTTYQYIKYPKKFIYLFIAIILFSLCIHEIVKFIYQNKHKKM